jgi:hypothetical protein
MNDQWSPLVLLPMKDLSSDCEETLGTSFIDTVECVYLIEPKATCRPQKSSQVRVISVCDRHGGGWSRKINAWHLYTLMVYL